MSKFGTKNALFETFGLDFLKNIFIFKISTFEFVELQKLAKNNN